MLIYGTQFSKEVDSDCYGEKKDKSKWYVCNEELDM